MEEDTKVLKITDFRHTRKNTPESLDSALKYTYGARLGVSSCEVSITDGEILITAGEVQYGNKRFTVDEVTTVPYCFSDCVGGTSYDSFSTIPPYWDDPERVLPYVDPTEIPVGKYANLWLYLSLGHPYTGSTDEVGEATIVGVLGNTLYNTEREAKSEYKPLTQVVPTDGVHTTFSVMGNIVNFARITVHAVRIDDSGDFPVTIYSYSVSQPMSFGFDTPPKPDAMDIPDRIKTVSDNNNYIITTDDRNLTLVMIAYDEGEGGYTADITLPAASDFGEGYYIKVISQSNYNDDGGTTTIQTIGDDSIFWPSSNGSSQLYTDTYYSVVKLTSDGNTYWVASDFSGRWTDGITDILFDGKLNDYTEGNIATFDEYGNLIDSGYPVITETLAFAENVGVYTSDHVIAGEYNNTVFVGDSTTQIEFTLEASPAPNRTLYFKNCNTGPVLVSGSHLIDGESTIVLGKYDSIKIIFDYFNSRWHII